jgi:cytoskeletal protein RodZ
MTEAEFYEMLKVQMELLNKDLERVFALIVGLMAVFVFFLIIALFLWTHYLYTENRSKKNDKTVKNQKNQLTEGEDDGESEERDQTEQTAHSDAWSNAFGDPDAAR